MNSYLSTLDEFESMGVRKIGEGRDRITFTSGSIVDSKISCVIKVSRSDGSVQNAEEITIWERLDKEAKKNVAWILDWEANNRWVIQERVSQITKSSSATSEVINNLNDSGWSCTDIRPDNVGRREQTTMPRKRPKRPVLVDLGVGIREI